MMTLRMGKRLGSCWSVGRLFGVLVGLVFVMGLSTCKVIEEGDDSDTQVPGLPDMNFRLVPSGTFQMGSLDGGDETQHEVTISQGFWLQESEVTQDQWQQVMGNNPSTGSSCPQCPVTNVSWSDVQNFISALNSEYDQTYRLPTEAEWEYAARAGSDTDFANGDMTEPTCDPVDSNLDEMGWYCFNSTNVSHAVKGKLDNDFNLYDMHGNVAEWVQDWYGDYAVGPLTDPTGPTTGSNRVARGGAFNSLPPDCRSAARANYSASTSANNLGFRLVWVK